jgi:hypothetical protein
MTIYKNKNCVLSYVATDTSGNVGFVTDMGDISPTSDKLETTPYSTSDYRTYIQGLKDVDDISIVVNFDPSNNATNLHANLMAFYETGEDVRWTITFPDTSTFAFSAFVSSPTISTAIGEVYTGTFTLAPTNTTDPVFTDAT